MRVHSMSRPIQALLLALACSLPSGCVSVAGLQDLHYSTTNKYRASEAWKCNFSKEQRRSCSQDFEQGFKTGYYDTAMGKDCRLPPVAPPQYWSARYQSCTGQCAVQDWFKGYQQGIIAAQSSGCSSFSEIPVSPGAPVINKTACGLCFSPNHCNCSVPYDDSTCSGSSGAMPGSLTPTEHTFSADPYMESAQSKPNTTENASSLPGKQAIMPVSYDTGSGLIGGYGLKPAQ